MMRWLPPFAAAFMVSALVSCLGGGNSGSETTNGLAGIVKDVEGRPVAGARVLLLPEEYDPAAGGASQPLSAVTDPKGYYLLEEIPPGSYNLELSDSLKGGLSLIRDVVVSAESVAMLNGTIGKPGSLAVRLIDFLGADDKGYLYIPGTTSLLRVDGDALGLGMAKLERVPVGSYPRLLLVAGMSADRKVDTLAEDFEVFAESTSALPPFQSWKSNRRIPVDSKAAGVNGRVTDFPLLVRLNAANFDFGEAQREGRDVRFSKADGTPIPHRIERWDADAGRAEIWARLDTVEGARADQYINMHWGRNLAAPGTPGPEVFDPAAGFATVYHLDETANADPGGYKDATPNRNHATMAAINPNARVEGIVAGAKAFAGQPLSTVGVLTAAIPKGFQGDFSYTISFWMRFEATSTRQAILDFGRESTLKGVHFLIRADTIGQFGAFDLGRSSGADPATWQNAFALSPYVGKWTHMATVYDASKRVITTYVNGVKAAEAPTQPLAINPGDGLRIGQALVSTPLDMPFNGALDEIRFCNRALTADRIKLDYETQKP